MWPRDCLRYDPLYLVSIYMHTFLNVYSFQSEAWSFVYVNLRKRLISMSTLKTQIGIACLKKYFTEIMILTRRVRYKISHFAFLRQYDWEPPLGANTYPIAAAAWKAKNCLVVSLSGSDSLELVVFFSTVQTEEGCSGKSFWHEEDKDRAQCPWRFAFQALWGTIILDTQEIGG